MHTLFYYIIAILGSYKFVSILAWLIDGEKF